MMIAVRHITDSTQLNGTVMTFLLLPTKKMEHVGGRG
jgi:hypothetical protein